MFERIRYKRLAREYFRPSESTFVTSDDFLKVLKGEMFNPIRLENPKTSCDYGFMVVGVDKKSPINSWAGQKWGSNGYETSHSESWWYGKISAESSSRIIIPPRTQIDFHYKSNSYLGGKIHISTFEIEPWSFGGFMQSDKDWGNRILVSNLSVEQVVNAVKQVYAEQRDAKFYLLDNLS